MFPGMGKIDPKKLQGMMKQLGINQEDIDAERVVIECSDRNIVISNPSVQKVKMGGNESWQITGDVSEEGKGISKDDIKLVMEKTGKSEKDAKKALEDAKGDIAEAIVQLS